MSVTKKFAALGAAAAISATGLVAATGTSAHAADLTKTVGYECTNSLIGLDHAAVSADFTIASTLKQSGAAQALPMSAKITFPQDVSAIVVQLGGEINGSVAGTIGFGSASANAKMAITKAPVTDPNAPSTVPARGSATVLAKTVGAQNVTLPSKLTATFDVDAMPAPVVVDCVVAAGQDLAAGAVNVTPGTAATGDSAALKAAKAKLVKDQAKLKAAKKALKKAKGHKKVVLKKKIVKLNKVIKADKKKIKSLS